MVDVEQRLIPLDQDIEIEPIPQREVGAPIGDGVRLPLIGDVECVAHAGARLGVPAAGGGDAGLLPEIQLQGIGAGVVAAAHKERLSRRDLAHRLDRGRLSPDPSRIVSRSDDHEVVVHHDLAGHAESCRHKSFFSGRAVGEQDISLALLAELQRGAGTDCDGLEVVARLLLEEWNQHVEQPGVLGAGGRREDDIPRASDRCRLRRSGSRRRDGLHCRGRARGEAGGQQERSKEQQGPDERSTKSPARLPRLASRLGDALNVGGRRGYQQAALSEVKRHGFLRPVPGAA